LAGLVLAQPPKAGFKPSTIVVAEGLVRRDLVDGMRMPAIRRARRSKTVVAV
jgi:hypothetical protein